MAGDDGHRDAGVGRAGDGPDHRKEAEIQAKLRDGSIRLYELEKQLPTGRCCPVRREFIEQATGAKLEDIGIFSIDADRAATRNCENMIGTVQVPVGVAGPLAINGEYAKGSFWLPLATTEGALVASVNRGAGAITKAGGAEVRILHDGMTRAPVFAAHSVGHAKEIADWAETHEDDLAAIAATTTSHGKMTGLVTFVAGTSVFVRLEFDTKDAMGMNMVTIASAKIADEIAQATGARLIALSGNMCTDKKPAAINGIMGRAQCCRRRRALPRSDREGLEDRCSHDDRGELPEEPCRFGPGRCDGIQCPRGQRGRRDVYCLRAGRCPCNRR